MADIKTANLAKLVTKQAGRAKEKVRTYWTIIQVYLDLINSGKKIPRVNLDC